MLSVAYNALVLSPVLYNVHYRLRNRVIEFKGIEMHSSCGSPQPKISRFCCWSLWMTRWQSIPRQWALGHASRRHKYSFTIKCSMLPSLKWRGRPQTVLVSNFRYYRESFIMSFGIIKTYCCCIIKIIVKVAVFC